jgi:hypothetical protein
MRKILGLSEWQLYAILSLAAVVVSVIGLTFNIVILVGGGILVLLFSLVGIVYGIAKERSP